jgi:TRAP-type transport system small permease protein
MKRTFLGWIDRFEDHVTLFFFWIMCLFVLMQMVARYIMKSPLGFPDEVARHAYVWMTFIGLSLATKYGDHIRVDLLDHLLKGKAAVVLEVIVTVGTLVLLVIMSVLGWKFAGFTRVNRWSSLPVLSMFLVNVSFPLGCILATLRAAQILGRLIIRLRKGE